jgi:hypothetical protein
MKRTDRNPCPERFEREIATTASNEIKNCKFEVKNES